MIERRSEILWGALAIGFGIAAFFAFAGWWVLIPTNISWLEAGDRPMHTLGWFFFRDGPSGLPPGGNPNLGLELASSIALVDGLPILALPLKLLSGLLPRPFQYWGYWWLICFILQAWFGYRLARALAAPPPIAFLAAAFVVIAPAFLYRLPLHMALAGHWVILAALVLYARPVPPRRWMWPLLAGVTAAIHAYLLAMVLAIWFAAVVQRWITRGFPKTHLADEAVALASVITVVMWGVGFFYTGGVQTSGYGYYRLNLLGFFISHHVWSQWAPSLPHSDGDYEGLSFLGVGIFGAFLVALATGGLADLRHIFSRRWWPIGAMLVLLAIFALSDSLGILDVDVMTVKLPWPLELIGGIFRSTGRFIWPLLYMTIVVLVVLAARRLQLRVAAPVLATLLVAQVYDSRQGWGEFRSSIAPPASVWRTALQSPFWDRLAPGGIKKIRAIRQHNGIEALVRNFDWKDIEDLAYRQGLLTDVVRLGRTDPLVLYALDLREWSAMVAGNAFDTDTLYLVDFGNAQGVMQHLAADDLFADIDNHIVYVRHGARLVDGLGIDPQGARQATPWVADSRFTNTR